MAFDLEQISREFDVDFIASPYGNGHINDTYIVEDIEKSKPRWIKLTQNIYKSKAVA